MPPLTDKGPERRTSLLLKPRGDDNTTPPYLLQTVLEALSKNALNEHWNASVIFAHGKALSTNSTPLTSFERRRDTKTNIQPQTRRNNTKPSSFSLVQSSLKLEAETQESPDPRLEKNSEDHEPGRVSTTQKTRGEWGLPTTTRDTHDRTPSTQTNRCCVREGLAKRERRRGEERRDKKPHQRV